MIPANHKVAKEQFALSDAKDYFVKMPTLFSQNKIEIAREDDNRIEMKSNDKQLLSIRKTAIWNAMIIKTNDYYSRPRNRTFGYPITVGDS
jgi:hypothetical protein